MNTLGSLQSVFKYNQTKGISATHIQIDNLLASASLWFDGQDLTTIYNGSSQVNSNGENVTTWYNKNNRNLYFSSSGAVSYSSTKGITSGSNTTYMYINNPSLVYNNNSTIFVIYEDANFSSPNFQAYFNYGSTERTTHGNEISFCINYGNVGTNYGTSQINQYFVNAVIDNTNNFFGKSVITSLIRQQATNGYSTAYGNSYEYSQGNVSINWDTGTPIYMSLFGYTNITTYNSPANSTIAEVIMINSVLSTSDRELIEAYLAWKWNLQSYLNPSNPYASTNPY